MDVVLHLPGICALVASYALELSFESFVAPQISVVFFLHRLLSLLALDAMNVCGAALVKGGHKMVLELAPASTAEPSFTTPPQSVNLMSQVQDGLLDAHPSKCDLTSRQVQMQVNNTQHRFNLIPGAAGQWHSQAMAQLCSWLLKPATERGRPESPSPRMILDEPKEDTAPLALPDLAMVEPDVAAVVEGKPEKDDGNAGIEEGKSEEEDDSDVIVERQFWGSGRCLLFFVVVVVLIFVYQGKGNEAHEEQDP